MQVRQAQPVDLRVHSSSVRCRHHQTREHGLGATEEQRSPDSAREREPARQRRKQLVHLGVDPLGDRQRGVRAAGRRLTGNAGLAQAIPNVPDRRLGVRVEDQLDGMHHALYQDSRPSPDRTRKR